MAKKYLIIQTAFIGDVILATPVIESLKKHNPEIRIDVLVKKENSSVLDGNKSINKVFTLDKSKKLKSIFSLIQTFRSIRYDCIINLHRFASSGIICALSGGKETRGFSKNPLSMFYSKKIKHIIQDGIHEVDRNLSLIDDIVAQSIRKPHIDISDEVRQSISSYQSKKYYCLAPASVWKTKEAPLSIWSKLIEQLNGPEESHIFLIGGPKDFEKSEALKKSSQHKNIINLCGKLSLIESAALMQNAVRNYVNDSAPLHLASALNAPVSVFYCSTSPKFGFGPLSEDSKIIEVKNLDCKPCGLHGHRSCPKGHFKCGNELELG